MQAPLNADPRTPPLFSAEFTRDPYPTYEHHLQGPALQLLDPARRLWGAFRYDLLQDLFRDGRLSSVRPAHVLVRASEAEMPEFTALVQHMQRWLLLKDAPAHTSLRKAMNRGFSNAIVERWRPKIERQVRQILDALESSPQIDIIRDLAYPLPVRIISTLLGVPDGQLDRCVELSNVIAIWFASVQRTPDSARPAQAAILELAGYFGAIIARRRSEGPSEDLLDFLLQIVDADPSLSEEDLLAQCVMLLFAGHETTRHWIGNSVYTFLDQPGLFDALGRDAALVRPAMEEVLRFQGPVQMFGRTVLREIAIDGAHLVPGDSLLLVVAAANRDPNQFEEPNRFDPRRPHIRHFTFGGDAHVCLGSTLARLEGVITVRELVGRFPSMHLTQAAPDWGSMIAFRGLNTLHVAA